jgi:nitrogen fixation/metabolism regulation signal transduction histidine kinase
LLATVWLAIVPGHVAGVTVLGAIAFGLAFDLWYFVLRSNRETARFLDAARYSDFSQRFSLDGSGSGFSELGAAFNDILSRMRERSQSQATELRRLNALIEHIPVPLLTLHTDGAVTLQNNASRRLLGAHHVTRIEDLEQFGKSFQAALSDAVPGARELVTFTIDGVEYNLTLATTEIVVANMTERLISLQDIQSELDATQAEAWHDLVRVLTHEIMNSITPVTSLAATAAEFSSEIRDKAGSDSPLSEDLADLHSAISTVARRSDSLVRFVNNYRQITRMRTPEKSRVPLAELFQAAISLARAEWSDPDVTVETTVEPGGLDVLADRDLLEPVLINLLRNAWQATRDEESPQIELLGRLNRRGNVIIEVIDNGAGVPRELETRIFASSFPSIRLGLMAPA